MSVSIYFTGPELNIDSQVNISNSNGSLLLSALGFDPEHNNSLSLPLDEFLGACDLYLTSDLPSVIDQGREPVKDGIMIDCGLRKGYLTELVIYLVPLAITARAMGAKEIGFY